jgi:ubiquinone/menaquinone biosynthesis C-methylase UbiE
MAGVIWRQADAMRLPFPDGSFDLIVCQFGVMFFLDKQTAFREAARVLRQAAISCSTCGMTTEQWAMGASAS